MHTAISFALPEALVATAPPERRGLGRDGVRLLVIDRATGGASHATFRELGSFLRPGDLLVFNASRTIPACLFGRVAQGGPAVELRLAERLPDDSWLALALADTEIEPGALVELGAGLLATVGERDESIPKLRRVRFSESGVALTDLLYRIGQPVRYEYVAAPWALDDYQTIFATEPGSAEMPSAGRPFTWRLVFELARRKISTASIVLHTGLSSYLDDEADAQHMAAEEAYRIDEAAARAINGARAAGGRVVAIGTTVVRALETAARADGTVAAGAGYTRLRVTEDHSLRAVDGILTGLHEPEASHLDLLAAFAAPSVVEAAYSEAVERGYLWHEFGDVNLIL